MESDHIHIRVRMSSSALSSICKKWKNALFPNEMMEKCTDASQVFLCANNACEVFSGTFNLRIRRNGKMQKINVSEFSTIQSSAS